MPYARGVRRAFVFVVMLAHCKDPPAPLVEASTTVTPVATSAAITSSSAPIVATTATTEIATPTDAGLAGCTIVTPPTKLARRGPYVAVSRMGFVDFYARDGDAPALAGSVHVDARGSTPASSAPPVAPSDKPGDAPACATSQIRVFCMNSAGEIRRFRFTDQRAEPETFVARARPGAAIAAGDVSGHAVVAYLRDRTTSEGNTSEAYVESDDGAELRLSEEGAGATSVALVSRGSNAVAVYVDARRAMSPVHARTITASPKLALGKDVVLFVGGSAETNTRASLGASGGNAFALVPIAHDLDFGVATVKIGAEPATDSPVAWSDYPNGIDPAPIAATTDGARAFVARVRPSAPKFGSPRVLELGALDATGAFASFGIASTQGAPRDVAIASDGANGFVLAFTDSAGGWSERLSCEKK
jgi:hypothetical protein